MQVISLDVSLMDQQFFISEIPTDKVTAGALAPDRRLAFIEIALFVLAFNGILTYKRIGVHADHLQTVSIRRRGRIIALSPHYVPGAKFCTTGKAKLTRQGWRTTQLANDVTRRKGT